eukprot:scaffold5884_cov38-Phaeocystis_antarctica.AAC.2
MRGSTRCDTSTHAATSEHSHSHAYVRSEEGGTSEQDTLLGLAVRRRGERGPSPARRALALAAVSLRLWLAPRPVGPVAARGEPPVGRQLGTVVGTDALTRAQALLEVTDPLGHALGVGLPPHARPSRRREIAPRPLRCRRPPPPRAAAAGRPRPRAAVAAAARAALAPRGHSATRRARLVRGRGRG